jgi:hypothetical protein
VESDITPLLYECEKISKNYSLCLNIIRIINKLKVLYLNYFLSIIKKMTPKEQVSDEKICETK